MWQRTMGFSAGLNDEGYMKKNLLISIWFTLVTTVLLGVIYPLVVTGLAQVIFPKQANGELIKQGDKLLGSHLLGQPFTAPGYFYSRPSAAGAPAYESPCVDSSGPGHGIRLRPRSRRLARRRRIPDPARSKGARHERTRRASSRSAPHNGPPMGLSRRTARQRPRPEPRPRRRTPDALEADSSMASNAAPYPGRTTRAINCRRVGR